MRWTGPEERFGARIVGALALAALVMALVAGSAAAAGSKKLVEGTVYDTTCVTACLPDCPPPPHCGPITAGGKEGVVCPMAERMIACPLSKANRAQRVFRLCSLGGPVSCGTEFPVYMGDGAVVTVRSKRTGGVIGPLPVVEGHFKVRLGPGYWVIRPYIPPEPECWTGPQTIEVTAKMKSPVSAVVDVSDQCVAHPDAAKE
jgi:hypothetical protein